MSSDEPGYLICDDDDDLRARYVVPDVLFAAAEHKVECLGRLGGTKAVGEGERPAGVSDTNPEDNSVRRMLV